MPPRKPAKPQKSKYNPEAAAEEFMQLVDDHELSQPDVPQHVSREFWQTIISSLQGRIRAMDGDG
jgi:hypothetical protein